jgi:hypothetical protein
VNVSNSSPVPLSHKGQGPKSPLAALALLSLVLERCREFQVDGMAQAWHDFLFLLLIGSLSVDLFLELLRSTTAGLHGARAKIEPVWPAIADMCKALTGLLKALLPPRQNSSSAAESQRRSESRTEPP